MTRTLPESQNFIQKKRGTMCEIFYERKLYRKVSPRLKLKHLVCTDTKTSIIEQSFLKEVFSWRLLLIRNYRDAMHLYKVQSFCYNTVCLKITVKQINFAMVRFIQEDNNKMKKMKNPF